MKEHKNIITKPEIVNQFELTKKIKYDSFKRSLQQEAIVKNKQIIEKIKGKKEIEWDWGGVVQAGWVTASIVSLITLIICGGNNSAEEGRVENHKVVAQIYHVAAGEKCVGLSSEVCAGIIAVVERIVSGDEPVKYPVIGADREVNQVVRALHSKQMDYPSEYLEPATPADPVQTWLLVLISFCSTFVISGAIGAIRLYQNNREAIQEYEEEIQIFDTELVSAVRDVLKTKEELEVMAQESHDEDVKKRITASLKEQDALLEKICNAIRAEWDKDKHMRQIKLAEIADKKARIEQLLKEREHINKVVFEKVYAGVKMEDNDDSQAKDDNLLAVELATT